MIGLVDRSNAPGTSFSKELAVDLILKSLPDKFSYFVMNFNMNKFELCLNKLHKMITNAETNLGKVKAPTSSVLWSKKRRSLLAMLSVRANPRLLRLLDKKTAERRTSVITMGT
ncbi:hypothetical protein LIER_19350 [Lithospermum erythrorhizon]|uniref:Uncharacterized protein n=1 Tax=Lithospermum erythrorhizon TaxID=34254 RepID=A0AAV3QHE3_LITER